ncbi:zinc dependent phospholipase C family protein [Methylotenera sp.]|uniref:zinc dependent phospholipase C family protein n=1 Tax=Methylotenera sp. TaxID=2051956 RepID=UPI002731CA76|nr:zinc dependent phospholipase C family protein [Methylotenera sp.]MDP2070986.1 zinc dependent phospholipase C family protein [Methylotenera sp.]MDP3005860.1 zinc dependent phospholipase C family protein [Methylotenera sp.]
MQLPAYLKKCYWWLPCCLYSIDANAWGLVTHLYFAQSLLWAMPLLDPRLQSAIKKFPELVMAGACLPDLAIVSHRYRHTHLWENAHQLMLAAQTDEELAIAIGYMSHLYVDVIAHNHFVPAHEAMWHKNEVLTHIASEWAMDAHLAPIMNTSPRYLLTRHQDVIAQFISINFRCTKIVTIVALKRLAFWDGILRFVRLPNVIYFLVRLLDKRVFRHFVYYIAKTQLAVADIGEALNGRNPILEPELKNLSMAQLDSWREQCATHLKYFPPKPIEYFNVNLYKFNVTEL